MSYQNVNAYKSNQSTQLDGREIDKRALINCAARMQAALDDGGKDMEAYQQALRHNQHLWTMFQVSLVQPENPLKKDLKLTLLRLSGYVDRVTFRSIARFNPEDLRSLININHIIATGLAKKPQNAAPATQQQATPTEEIGKPMAFSIST